MTASSVTVSVLVAVPVPMAVLLAWLIVVDQFAGQIIQHNLLR